jgi:hypothetical protein
MTSDNLFSSSSSSSSFSFFYVSSPKIRTPRLNVPSKKAAFLSPLRVYLAVSQLIPFHIA